MNRGSLATRRARSFRGLRSLAFLVAFGFLVISPAACFSGGGGGGSGIATLYRLNTMPVASEPSYIVVGTGGEVDVWHSGGTFSQARYASRDGRTKIRVLGDPATGDPVAIVDETNGEYILPTLREDGGVDFSHYDATGKWLDAIAIFPQDGGWKLANVVGAAAFEGQIQGQLSSALFPVSGSFAVVATAGGSGVTNVQDVTEQMEALLDAMDDSRWESTEGELGSVSSPLSLKRTLILAGTVLAGGAVAGALAPAYGAAGVAMIFGGVFSGFVGDFIEKNFVSEDPFVQSLVDTAVSNLREPTSNPLSSLMDKVIETAKNLVPRNTPFRMPTQIVEAYPGTLGNVTPIDYPPTPTSGPPPVDTEVAGQAVWQDSSTQQVTGTVNSDGSVDLHGVGQDPTDTLEVTGNTQDDTFVGSYERGEDHGTATGEVTDIAECQATQSAGGQGTFTNVHFVGSGDGAVTFYYDAYNVPDGFDVSVGGKKVFSTGGLVSGGGSSLITMKGEGYVFVSVSAPESDTAWEYSLSCLE